MNAMKSAFLHFEQRLALIDDVIKPGYAALGPGRLMPSTAESIFWIALCAVLAPLLVGLLLRGKVPEVVLLLVLGRGDRPERARPGRDGRASRCCASSASGMLFLLAGYEVEVEELVGRADGGAAPPGWCVSGSRSP